MRASAAFLAVFVVLPATLSLGPPVLSKQQIGSTGNRRNSVSLDALHMTESSSDAPVWDPVQQIYVGGKLPENNEVKELLESGDGSLRLFGYGSLCWNPGTGPLANPGVVAKLGRAKGYKRCWAQRSTDHRGNPKFPGIVCTLLEDHEVVNIRKTASTDVRDPESPTLTEGVIYWIPPELVAECLDELDFREKGGYAREAISVIEDESGETHKALLYRGTPDSPAFWNRVLLDLPHAAAIMAVSEGPSGKNDFYLNSLDDFLTNTHTIEAANDDTTTLASMVRYFQKNSDLYFLYGSGSNQHNQLLLDRPNNAACLVDGEDAHEIKEILVCTAKQSKPDLPTNIYAGGGHSGLLTESGKLYLWGWNDYGQCGNTSESTEQEEESPLPCATPLAGLTVQDAALGFSHTLVIEKDTNCLYAFGSNERCQVSSSPSAAIKEPMTPDFLKGIKVKNVAAGLFHSAVITDMGELITFGCGRFGQSLSNIQKDGKVCVGKWIPDDGTPLVDVACGRRHTVTVDEKGRIWTFGENKYGQLGRPCEGKYDPVPTEIDSSKVQIPVGSTLRLDCGWSHNIVQVTLGDSSEVRIYGWGRNDKGQLGTGSFEVAVSKPIRLFQDRRLSFVGCGSESTMAIDRETADILGCGWNEHGNIATGIQEDQAHLTKTQGSKVYGPPGLHDGTVILAVGGGHHMAMKSKSS